MTLALSLKRRMADSRPQMMFTCETAALRLRMKRV